MMQDIQIMQEKVGAYIEEHRNELISFVNLRVGNRVDAEDIVQDAFLKISTSYPLISDVTLPSLVYTILRNLSTDLLRHRYFQRLQRLSVKETYEIESFLIVDDIVRLVEHRLSRLPINTAKIYRMHIYEGKGVKEIALDTNEKYKSIE